MYSGSTLTTFSGRILGAHQKIDRVARKHLNVLLDEDTFPSIRHILYFEGGNGPDAIKRKSPAKDEPWHYIQPYDETDILLLELIEHHHTELVVALKQGDRMRAAFEAAWLAHAIVDGLTPAHHYPYEEKLVELRGGQGKETRTNMKEKLVMHGDTRREKLTNNWKMWGPKGLFTTHSAFEWGVATLIMPLRLQTALPTKLELQTVQDHGVKEWFRLIAKEVADMGLYDAFYRRGWTPKLAKRVKQELAPIITKAVTTAWYSTALQAEQR